MTMATLKKSAKFSGVEGPLLTIVMDGVGIAPDNGENAVANAHTPTLDWLMANYPTLKIKAHIVKIPVILRTCVGI